MRRRDREVTELNEIIHILDSGKVLHLGLVDQGKPYIVPVNYGYVMEMINLYFMCTVLWKAVSLTLSETIQTAVFRLSVMFSHFQVKWPANMGVVIILLMDLELRRLWKHHKKKLRP